MIGLKPWEFQRMTPREYLDYAQGFRVRECAVPSALRTLYFLQYNTKVKKGAQLRWSAFIKNWPLYTDAFNKEAETAKQEAERMVRTFREQLKLSEENARIKH